MRRAAKIDMNQPTIVAALVGVGCCVQSLASVGAGVPDLLVWSPFLEGTGLALIEVKNPDQAPSDRCLTDDQKKFHKWWRGPISVCETSNEALAAVGAI